MTCASTIARHHQERRIDEARRPARILRTVRRVGHFLRTSCKRDVGFTLVQWNAQFRAQLPELPEFLESCGVHMSRRAAVKAVGRSSRSLLAGIRQSEESE